MTLFNAILFQKMHHELTPKIWRAICDKSAQRPKCPLLGEKPPISRRVSEMSLGTSGPPDPGPPKSQNMSENSAWADLPVQTTKEKPNTEIQHRPHIVDMDIDWRDRLCRPRFQDSLSRCWNCQGRGKQGFKHPTSFFWLGKLVDVLGAILF